MWGSSCFSKRRTGWYIHAPVDCEALDAPHGSREKALVSLHCHAVQDDESDAGNLDELHRSHVKCSLESVQQVWVDTEEGVVCK
ncbi:hypothetical protein E2C01_046752 [Portunus trituberculatus]|uniref:Uncharacterized protein n=1 Tax=Portunus trituberculatus TaxID=210409 RepID=A0A5B7G8M0_PORTR|nr:hypothetical protein [Portunus trituberculatus]